VRAILILRGSPQVRRSTTSSPWRTASAGHACEKSSQGAHARIASSVRCLPCSPRLNGLMMGSAIPERR
jgi:hypothetical protein